MRRVKRAAEISGQHSQIRQRSEFANLGKTKIFVGTSSSLCALSVIENKLKKITSACSDATCSPTTRYADKTGSMWRALWAGTLETTPPFVIKEKKRQKTGRLSDNTVTVDCKDPVLLACCQYSLAHRTQTSIICQAQKAAMKAFYAEREIRKESLTACDWWDSDSNDNHASKLAFKSFQYHWEKLYVLRIYIWTCISVYK